MGAPRDAEAGGGVNGAAGGKGSGEPAGCRAILQNGLLGLG